MAGNSIKISTDQVGQIANSLEALNKRLSEELTSSKATIDGLNSVWEGEAAQSTISAYDEFATKYFQKYEDVITQYVKFLRGVVVGYEDTEAANTGLADSLK